jgi:hypothetical protein
MKSSFRSKCIVVLALISTVGVARAVSLYWVETRVKTGSYATCIAFAGDAMRLSNLQNIRRLPNEVAGTFGNNYAAITCVATTPNATAVVMVAGENGTEAMRLRDTLRAKIAGMIRFD